MNIPFAVLGNPYEAKQKFAKIALKLQFSNFDQISCLVNIFKFL